VGKRKRHEGKSTYGARRRSIPDPKKMARRDRMYLGGPSGRRLGGVALVRNTAGRGADAARAGEYAIRALGRSGRPAV